MSSPVHTPALNPETGRQAEQDAHLAASLTNAGRTRSGTLIRHATDEQLNGVGSPGAAGGSGGAAAASSTPQRSTTAVTTFQPPDSRRRPSFSQTRSGDSAIDAMGHLADDLAREDREEEARLAHEQQQQRRSSTAETVRDLDREAAVIANMRARRQQQPQHPYHGTPSSMPRSAVAARLYRQQNLSDSSIDSNGGAFIDHRRQPHSLSIGASPRTVGGGGNTSARSPEIMPIGGGGSMSARKGGGSSGLRRYSSSAGADDSYTRSPTSPRPFDPAIAARGYSVSPDDGDDHDGRDHERSRPVHFLERQPSRGSLHSQMSGHSSSRGSGHGTPRDTPYNVDMSRPGSGFGKPEDDICFPAHGAAPELDYIDMRDADHHHHHHHEGAYADPAEAVPLPGVLPNFPFPFDFGALEDFAEHEREGMPIPSARKRRGGAGGAAGGEDYGVSSATATQGRSPGGTTIGNSYENETASPRTGAMGGGRRRRMSEGVTHGGRMRRKLALFEGAGDDLGVGTASPATLGHANGVAGGAPLSDTKTPLLAERRGAGGYGAAVGPDGRKTGGARPYRFSFYSNSLPTTIHARSLAELPAEGQTFEELFCGSRPHGEDEAAAEHHHHHPQAPSAVSLDGRLANLASSHQHSNSGAATPTSTVNNASTSKLLGSLPAGVSATTMRNDRPKTAVMRSDEDAEANTWWLDVTCPTDQEMKTLSKVRFPPPFYPLHVN